MSQIIFEFDITESCSDTYNADNIGVIAAFTSSRRNPRKLYLYKGDASTGELLETVTEAYYSEVGSNKVCVQLSNDYELEEDQLYTIYVPANYFWTWHDSYSSANVIDKVSPSVTISFYGGGEKSGTIVTMQSASPAEGSKMKTLGKVRVNFDGSVIIAQDAKVSLYNYSKFVKDVSLTYAEDTDTAVVADFGNEVLSTDGSGAYDYTVKIPQEAILSKDSIMLTRDIEISYIGDTYNLFGYETITPVPGSALSQIGTLRLVPKFPDGATPWQYAGNNGYVGKVYLYKGEDTSGELIGTYSTDLGSDVKSVQAKVMATLEPNTTYALRLPEGLVPATYYPEGATTARKMATWHSADTLVIYYGANTASKWSVKANDQLEKLGLVSLLTGGTVTANEGAKMALYCGADSVAEADINASGNFCYADFGDLALAQDSVYSLVIPDSAIVNMPKTTQKFKGITTPAPEATYYDVAYTVKSVIGDDVLETTSTSTKMAEDSVFTFTATAPDDKWTVAASAGTLGDNGDYSLTVASDTSVVVTLTYDGEVKYVDETTTGVFNIDSKELKISASTGNIVVEGATAGDKITLYALNGAKLGQWTVEQDRQTISVKTGAYLVVVNNANGKAAAKVSVK